VDFDGNIVGMNLCTRAGATQFVPKQLIVECMCDLGFWYVIYTLIIYNDEKYKHKLCYEVYGSVGFQSNLAR
jgi:hypothetical protein